MVNKYCVVVNYDKMRDKGKGNDWLFNYYRKCSMYTLLTPDRQILKGASARRTRDEEWPDIEGAARTLGIVPNNEKPTLADPEPPSGLAPTDLPILSTARFLKQDEPQEDGPVTWSNPSSYSITMRQGVPTLEWIVLKEPQWKRLLPPSGAQSWALDADLATDLLRLFRPAVHFSDPTRKDVLSATLSARVEPSKGPDVLVRLEGSVSILHPYYRSGQVLVGPRFVDDPRLQVPLPSAAPATGLPPGAPAGPVGPEAPRMWTESRVVGFFHYDPTQGTIRDLKLVSVGGIYLGTDGTSLPFGVAMRMIPPRAAASSK